MQAVLGKVALPDFGDPVEQPVVPAALHAARLAAFIDRVRALGLGMALVYADREHSANLSYLTGFDPRFEEALLVVGAKSSPAILTGPENQGSARAASAAFEVTLFPSFGLLGQDRSMTPPLGDVLRQLGLQSGMAVGLVGWKYFGADEGALPGQMFDLPSYIVDTVRNVVGNSGRIVNATALLVHPSNGMRTVNEIEQLAAFEFASCHTSGAVRRVVLGARPGMSEFEAARLLGPIGLPLSCHPMLSTGVRAALGLGSPSSKLIERGDPITVAYGVWGALNCRAGWMAGEAGELPQGAKDYIERLVAPYFTAVAQWYEGLGIGVTGGTLFDIIRRRLGDPFFGVLLNPGHLIHLDEWMNTPIYAGSNQRLVSGQALQADIIPATGTPYFTTNVEDGVAILDAGGRAALAERYPQAAERIEHRRDFMASALGINLKPEILPLSNMPGYLTPFFLSPESAMVIRR